MITAFYAVDRLEGKIAVLVGDDGSTVDMPRQKLPRRVREGSVLRVRVTASGPDWASAEVDKEEEERRRKELGEMLDEMKRSDPGGDITL